MSESEQEIEKRKLREFEGKNIAHYSVLLEAWIQTKMERDKTLVTLSAAGVGLLVTILTTAGVTKAWQIFLYLGAFTGFIVTILTSIKIYELNSKHVENELRHNSAKQIKMEKYDKRSIRFFMIGAICACSIGVVAACSQLKITSEDEMSKSKKTTTVSKRRKVIKSLDGIEGLRPQSNPTTNTVNPPSSEGPAGSNSKQGNTSGNKSKG